jgi:glyoxylase-like metal-dependent hydrolase (beta-lactamase superfamily II)
MQIEPLFDDQTGSLTYVVFDEQSGDAVVIDPVLDYDPAGGAVSTQSVERVARLLDERQLRLQLILETHVHADHLSGSQWLRERYGARLGVSAHITEIQALFGSLFNWPDFPADGRQFDLLLSDGQVIEAGTLRLTAIATPGHTPACLTYRIEDAIFTGDALLLEDVGVGRCDFPRGDAGTLYRSVTERLFTLPPETRVFAGHDYPPAGRTWRAMTTVGQARAANVQLRATMPQAEFVDKRTARDRTLSAPRLFYPSLQVNIAAGALPPPESNGRRYLRIPVTGP